MSLLGKIEKMTDSRVRISEITNLRERNPQISEITNLRERNPQISEIRGDLFSVLTEDRPNLAIAHCVSRDFKMGKGIALAFKNRFGAVDKLLKQKKAIGQTASLIYSSNNLLISYLVTKERYCDKPTYESLALALQDFKTHAEEHGVKTIAIPKLGCGLDRLEWSKVKPIIMDILSEFEIIVYYL